MTGTQTKIREGTSSTALSRDGATISYVSMGAGPSVLIIPGALSDGVWLHCVRIRPKSRNSPSILWSGVAEGSAARQGVKYGIEKEVDDVLALQRETGASFLVGHSFGGLVALEAARRNPELHKIAVYEPGVSINGSIPMSWMRGYELKLTQRRYERCLRRVLAGYWAGSCQKSSRMVDETAPAALLSRKERHVMLGLLGENLREHGDRPS